MAAIFDNSNNISFPLAPTSPPPIPSSVSLPPTTPSLSLLCSIPIFPLHGWEPPPCEDVLQGNGGGLKARGALEFVSSIFASALFAPLGSRLLPAAPAPSWGVRRWSDLGLSEKGSPHILCTSFVQRLNNLLLVDNDIAGIHFEEAPRLREAFGEGGPFHGGNDQKSSQLLQNILRPGYRTSSTHKAPNDSTKEIIWPSTGFFGGIYEDADFAVVKMIATVRSQCINNHHKIGSSNNTKGYNKLLNREKEMDTSTTLFNKNIGDNSPPFPSGSLSPQLSLRNLSDDVKLSGLPPGPFNPIPELGVAPPDPSPGLSCQGRGIGLYVPFSHPAVIGGVLFTASLTRGAMDAACVRAAACLLHGRARGYRPAHVFDVLLVSVRGEVAWLRVWQHGNDLQWGRARIYMKGWTREGMLNQYLSHVIDKARKHLEVKPQYPLPLIAIRRETRKGTEEDEEINLDEKGCEDDYSENKEEMGLADNGNSTKISYHDISNKVTNSVCTKSGVPIQPASPQHTFSSIDSIFFPDNASSYSDPLGPLSGPLGDAGVAQPRCPPRAAQVSPCAAGSTSAAAKATQSMLYLDSVSAMRSSGVEVERQVVNDSNVSCVCQSNSNRGSIDIFSDIDIIPIIHKGRSTSKQQERCSEQFSLRCCGSSDEESSNSIQLIDIINSAKWLGWRTFLYDPKNVRNKIGISNRSEITGSCSGTPLSDESSRETFVIRWLTPIAPEAFWLATAAWRARGALEGPLAARVIAAPSIPRAQKDAASAAAVYVQMSEGEVLRNLLTGTQPGDRPGDLLPIKVASRDWVRVFLIDISREVLGMLKYGNHKYITLDNIIIINRHFTLIKWDYLFLPSTNSPVLTRRNWDATEPFSDWPERQQGLNSSGTFSSRSLFNSEGQLLHGREGVGAGTAPWRWGADLRFPYFFDDAPAAHSLWQVLLSAALLLCAAQSADRPRPPTRDDTSVPTQLGDNGKANTDGIGKNEEGRTSERRKEQDLKDSIGEDALASDGKVYSNMDRTKLDCTSISGTSGSSSFSGEARIPPGDADAPRSGCFGRNMCEESEVMCWQYCVEAEGNEERGPPQGAADVMEFPSDDEEGEGKSAGVSVLRTDKVGGAAEKSEPTRDVAAIPGRRQEVTQLSAPPTVAGAIRRALRSRAPACFCARSEVDTPKEAVGGREPCENLEAGFVKVSEDPSGMAAATIVGAQQGATGTEPPPSLCHIVYLFIELSEDIELRAAQAWRLVSDGRGARADRPESCMGGAECASGAACGCAVCRAVASRVRQLDRFALFVLQMMAKCTGEATMAPESTPA